ncbi:MAG: aminoacyl-tRNA hydrolase [Synergistaceae bacterium]|nr:aminoacyl-tRNA hydrolase [Synergistaceae bacterium]
MRLIAGLGNPGTEYAFTRHNMGWQCIDFFVINHELGKPSHKFNAESWRWRDILFLKPLTYMNASGLSVSEAVKFYKIEHENILIIYDDMALPYGKLRLRAQGSAGGHNGLASIIGALGDLHIPRLRIGIGKAPGDMINYVLGHLSTEERENLPDILNRAESAINTWLDKDIQKAMTLINADPSEK